MKQILRYIQQRLSLRLGLVIVLIITVVFTLLFGLFFYGSKRYIQRAAIERASQLLDNTAERINGIMDETEAVTNFMAQTTPRHLVPDSLLVFTHRTVAENAFLTGFAISMEPDFFPEMGRYYSAYSLRHRPNDGDSIAVDSITTVREGPRRDSVGRLTNSFIRMQQSLAESVASIQRVNAELQQQNDELSRAYQLKLETNCRKTAFIQDMYHEIRTPLNIISGFAQVLAESLHVLPAEEVDDITARMQESATDISRLARELGEVATNTSKNIVEE